ncbi:MULTISPECIES: H-NS family nucleoid-associated regulatory protein [Eikenella]|uniref:H-NS histone family protein n=1 Tax=Eikenella longinqua TaxID=1795827 RepID=A0A1A9S393_9NEIS|nr:MULTISPECIES: H-NS histone family protein [Eikenella]OAM31273.1 H-NS histone family protein [Eikenella longinqua]
MASRETLDQLLEQKKALEDRIQRRLASEKKKKVNQIVSLMQTFDISLSDVEAGLKEKQSRPQYRNPQTGATWGGVGKRPKWIVEAQEKGIDIKKFLV